MKGHLIVVYMDQIEKFYLYQLLNYKTQYKCQHSFVYIFHVIGCSQLCLPTNFASHYIWKSYSMSIRKSESFIHIFYRVINNMINVIFPSSVFIYFVQIHGKADLYLYCEFCLSKTTYILISPGVCYFFIKKYICS